MIPKSALIAIYNHVDDFPPTKNTIKLLSKQLNEVFLVSRPNSEAVNDFNDNVKEVSWARQEPENPSLPFKIIQFARFVGKMRKVIARKRPDIIIVHDQMALYALYHVLKTTSTDALLWYHNHDVPDLQLIRKYSIGWFAAKVDQKIFPKLDVMSVPTEERLASFPTKLLKGETKVISNFPMKREMPQSEKKNPLGEEIRILFQGRITFNRGIEQVLRVLSNTSSSGQKIRLSLMGKMDENFRIEMDAMIEEYGVRDQVSMIGFLPQYDMVFEETRKHHIGLAAFVSSEVNYQNAGTASNKIYEYASCGLPVIYFDTPHYKKHLGAFNWAFNSDLSSDSLMKTIESVVANHEQLSLDAREDFHDKLNYEAVFLPILQEILNKR